MHHAHPMSMSASGPRGPTLLVTLAVTVLALLGPLAGRAPSAETPVDPSGVSIRIMARAPRTARLVLDSLGTHLVLEHGYDPVTGLGDGWRMAGSPAIRDRRAFEKRVDASTVRRIELGHSPHPAGGFEIFASGSVEGAGGRLPNPDLAEVKQDAEDLIATLPAEDANAPVPDFSVEVRALGYSQADGVMGVLKALGYTTVEYNVTSTTNSYDKLYEPIQKGEWKLPVIVKLVEGAKTSIMEPLLVSQQQELQNQLLVPIGSDNRIEDMGGTYLHDATTGEPLQRLLIVHDPDDPDSLKKLLHLIDEQVDVPARQIVIEALVLEIDRDKINDLGLTFSWVDDSWGSEWGRNALGQQTEFTLDFDQNRVAQLFQVKIHAMVGSGEAKILSNPSVLVLDGRQARIQIGQRVPVVTSTATANVVEQRVDYQTVGIVLNLRPRLSPDGTQVTMQAETIVSAVDPTVSSTIQNVSAPTFDNRLVQTYCRIADNTPFIVGGLVSEDRREEIRRVPGLSSIPLLGALFRRKTHQSDKKEVIIVLTPHVVPKDEKNFSRLIPKDSDQFDSFDNELFRNKYRIRRQDVFDLKAVVESQPLALIRARVDAALVAQPGLAEVPEIASLRTGAIPGEDILVRRMLWETIRRTAYAQHVDASRIITFQHGGEGAASLQLARLTDLLNAMPEGDNTLALSFDLTASEDSARFKTARVSYQSIPAAEYDSRLVRANLPAGDGTTPRPTLLLSREHSTGANLVDFVRSIMVLKELLTLNQNLPLRISEFYDGREIVYPSAEALAQNYHVIDADAARLFFEVQQYYPAFQCTFNASIRTITRAIDPKAELGPPENCTPQAPGPLIRLDDGSSGGKKSVARKTKAERNGQ